MHVRDYSMGGLRNSIHQALNLANNVISALLYRPLHPTPREAFMLPIASLSDFILSQCMTP